MPWQIAFTHDPTHDVVTATFGNVVLSTEADVARWRREVEAQLSRFGRAVDLLIDLGGLVVRPAASRAFGRERTEVLARYSNRSYRFHGDGATRTSIYTSSVLHGAAANVYESREAALRALLADRAAASGSR